MKLGYKLLLIPLVLLFSCNNTDQLEAHFKQYYLNSKSCLGNGFCSVKMKDITWFDWDTMKFRENDSGSLLDFFLSKKIVYSYFKSSNFDGPSGVEFGFGNEQLKNIYSKDNACFNLKIEKRKKELVYFLLPRDTTSTP